MSSPPGREQGVRLRPMLRQDQAPRFERAPCRLCKYEAKAVGGTAGGNRPGPNERALLTRGENGRRRGRGHSPRPERTHYALY